ncbi:hypothetical protein D8674_013122 [Pyrus ussuriensis x Pyrus communis]|uniref:Uncharacterized protein n=1 Tax=Pyrus ussuriensis x Pyrus communis TaxID=2448454 RepID=A0A5N5GRC8_9ROSA|nr:hypothetical protein D8674_013122 [Pyrus ussuriensis x Pyrus communis]
MKPTLDGCCKVSVFPRGSCKPTLVDEFSSADGDVQVRGDNVQEQHMEDEGWTQVPVRWTKNNSRGRGFARRDGRSYDNVVKGIRTWVSRADLVSKWCPMVDGGSVSGASGGKSSAMKLVNDKGRVRRRLQTLKSGMKCLWRPRMESLNKCKLGVIGKG